MKPLPRLAGLGLLLLAAAPLAAAEPSAAVGPFGKLPDGREVQLVTLTQADGSTARIMTYGAILTSMTVPDRGGKLADVVLGFDTLEGYLKGHPYFGSNVGRVANRIAKGKFTLDGKQYTLATNNGPNALHGGKEGFDKKLWELVGGKPRQEGSDLVAQFAYTSKDGEEGYPGTLKVLLTYTFTARHELKVQYEATTDAPTPVNLAHHSYFNLAGHDSGTVLGHELQLSADRYTPTDDTLIPTGKVAPVAGTPFDFTRPTAIGKRIAELKGEPGGYDLNYVLGGGGKDLKPVAVVTEPKSGRVLTVTSTEPGVQFYSGNFLDGTNVGKGGAVYRKHHGFCLEPQHFPDSVNQPDFPGTILKPGAKYAQTTVYAFSAAK